MARYGLLDPADINEIGIDAEDHVCRALARPRSIAARITFTTSARPSNIASPTRK
jgi:hypothetical protein